MVETISVLPCRHVDAPHCYPIHSHVAMDMEPESCTIVMLHFASQIIVQKQQMYLGAKRTPPG
jgi:hypothetical protein